jgi:Ca2+-binding EF-hand superfamily protein
MKRHGLCGMFLALLVAASFMLPAGSVWAQPSKPPDSVYKAGFQEILKAADKNGDGKLSMDECVAISKDKKKVEKDCKYWDANGDGTITQDEYVQQAKKMMR